MGHTLMISEKPDAMKKIAEALADKKSLKKHVNENNVAYYEFKRGGKKHVVVCAVGHLFNLNPVKKGKGWNYPIYDAEWKPSYEVRKGSAFSKKYFDVVKQNAKGASKYIVCTDFDNEGSVIGFNILRFIYNIKDGRRMKFSTLTKDDLIESYEKMTTHLDYPQIEAGLTRHYLDWLWGINLTRALTLAMKNNGQKGFAILSTGRVQGPTLSMLSEKELDIKKFKSSPFWQIELLVKMDGLEIIANYEKDRILEKNIADSILATVKGKDAIVNDIKKRSYKQTPPVPFNTTDLQAEAYSQFKYSPTQTLSIAEGLYQAGYISYPRSSSQKLPPSINYKKIMSALAKLKSFSKFVGELMKKELVPHEGKREDAAHPAVYPTNETPDFKKITSQQKRLYDLIVRRFLAVFADEAQRESSTVSLDVSGHRFSVVGKRTIEPGWTKIYGNYMKTDEQTLPELNIGDKLKIKNFDLLSKETQPPPRFSQGSILREMEKRNLGTRATRAEILQTLYNRDYISGQSIKVTKLGLVVSKALKDNVPEVLSEELTSNFESDIEDVLKNKRKRELVVSDAEKFLTKVLKEFRKNEKKIGKKLLEGLLESREDARRIGPCIHCKVGELKILRSRFSGKFFVGCSSYFRCKKCGFTRTACKCKCGMCSGQKGKCKDPWKEKVWAPSCQTGYPLPGMAKIIPTGKNCETCKTPMIQVIRKAKRPFRMCLDPKCETKADWGKKKGDKKTKKPQAVKIPVKK